ncbi:hypothetical protein ACFL1U_00105 [Patescibacteria group bacterium]
MKLSSKTTKQQNRSQGVDAVSANEVVEEYSIEKRSKKPLWFGILTGAFIAAIALVLLWQDALPGVALRRPNIDRETIPQVPPSATAQLTQDPEETPEIIAVEVETVALANEKKITATDQAEKLIRSANDSYGNPGTSWAPNGSTLLFSRASDRTDYASQQTGIAPENLWSYTPKTKDGKQISTSGALGWGGSWGSVRFNATGSEVLYYELFSTSEQTVNGPRILSSSKDGFYSVALNASNNKTKLNVPSESRILTKLEDKAFPSASGERVLFVTQAGEYLWQDGDKQYPLGVGIDEVNGERQFRFSMPSWSPDGSQIAFTRKMDATDEAGNNVSVYVLDMNETASLDQMAPIGVAHVPENHLVFEDIDIDWAPDGQSFWIGSGHTLFQIENGSAKQIKTGEDVRPFAWSPEGKQVLALAQRDTTEEHFQIISLEKDTTQELDREVQQAAWISENLIITRTVEGLSIYNIEKQQTSSLLSKNISDFSLAPNHKDLAWVAEGELWIAQIQ